MNAENNFVNPTAIAWQKNTQLIMYYCKYVALDWLPCFGKHLYMKYLMNNNNRKQANQNPREEINLKEIECSK